MNKNVLVFPCGSEIGLEIHRSLNQSIHFTLFGGSSISDHGEYVYENYIGDMPHIDDESFIDKLNQVIDDFSIDFIFPAHDSVVLKLAQEKHNERIHCEVITSSLETCEISRSKKKTYERLAGIVPVPKLFVDKHDIVPEDFPVFLKPDVGQGSKGTHKAINVDDIEFYKSKDASLLTMEFLPGKEYTIDCFTDKENKLMYVQGRERRRVSNGISVDSYIVENSQFLNIAEKINHELSFRGAWFFQVKENKDGQLVLMEIAPRIAGTMGLSRARGANLALLSLFDALGYGVDIFLNDYGVTIDRALENKYKHNINYDHVYIDFDDTVIFREKVNPAIIQYLYQCLNNGIKIHLLTRHNEDLHETLKKYRLTNVFDELIWLKEKQPKSDFIREKNAIFIDDSFAERFNVHDKLNIPVFDAHMIEMLIQ